jgi:hypothetical protein
MADESCFCMIIRGEKRLVSPCARFGYRLAVRGVEVEGCLSPGLRVPSTPELGWISIECGKGKFPSRGQR